MTRSATPDYDFFAPSPGGPVATPAGSGAPPQPPLAAPATSTVNQFGSPVAAGTWTPVRSGASVPPIPPAPASTTALDSVPRWVWRITIPLAIALVLGVFGVGRFTGVFQGDLELPATLGGAPLSTDPRISSSADAFGEGLEDDFGDAEKVFGVYSDGATGTLLAAVREGTDVRADIAASGADIGSPVEVGDATCVVYTGQNATACGRSEGDLTAIVAAFAQPDVNVTAALLGEAWEGF